MTFKFELFLVIPKKKQKLINIKLLNPSLPLILYIELDMQLCFLWFIYIYIYWIPRFLY